LLLGVCYDKIIESEEDMEYKEWIKKYSIKLNQQQEKAVLAIDGSILLLAVPGSGKTTVIVSRVGYMILCKNINPENILTLTYSVAAASDMKERYKKVFGDTFEDQLNFRTINSFCCDVIRYYERIGNTKKFDLIKDKEKYKIISVIYREVENNFPTESIISDIISKTSYFKNMLLSDKEIKEIEYEDANIYEIYNKYLEYNKSNKLMDFDDQLVYSYIILKNYPTIREFFTKQYKYINVDEAQDTSKIQHEIINYLVNGNIFMVGDEDQSIYKFRGAYPEALLQFEKRYTNSKVLLMETNYRSTPEIIEVSNSHIKRNKTRKDKNMVACRNAGSLVTKKDVDDLNEQYEYLLSLAKHNGKETFAIIYKNNDSAIPLIWLFNENNINFNLKGGEITFFSHKIVRDIKSYINFIMDQNNMDSFKEICYKLDCSISKVMLEEVISKFKVNKNKNILNMLLELDIPKWKLGKIYSILKEIRLLKNQSPYKIINSIVNNLGYKKFLVGNEKDSDKKLSAIYEQKINLLYYISMKEKNINNFLKRLEYIEKLCKNSNNIQENITLTTIHSSKGLEFDKVVLIDMNEGIIPSSEKSDPSKSDKSKKDTSKEDYEEDVRLFYVAITRAKKELEIISCKNSFDESIVISEFVDSIFKKSSSKTFFNTFMKKRSSCKDISIFKVGDTVENLTFGIGEILEIKGDEAIIDFKRKGKKKMILHYLTKI
jgi:DNA helicase II / ATP-dependent DNA helicase PcrA